MNTHQVGTKEKWLDWNAGHLTEIQYKQKSRREIPVKLKINSHKPEPLGKVMRHDHTHLQEFLVHGYISAQHPRSSVDKNGRPASAANMTRKQFYNSNMASFNQKRNRKWEDYNFRPKSQWKQLEKSRRVTGIVGDCVRDRNHRQIYKEAMIENYDNLIAKLDGESRRTASLVQGQID